MSNSPSGSSTSRMSALDGRDAPSGRPADPLPGPVEHRLAQVDQGGVEVRQALQQLEGVVAGPAAHVEDVPGVGRRGRCRLGDQRHRQRRIDRGRLAGFEVGEPLHVGVEPLPDFIHRRFHRPLPVSATWRVRVKPASVSRSFVPHGRQHGSHALALHERLVLVALHFASLKMLRDAMSSSLYDLGQWATTKKGCFGSYSAPISTKKPRAFHGLHSTKVTCVFVVRLPWPRFPRPPYDSEDPSLFTAHCYSPAEDGSTRESFVPPLPSSPLDGRVHHPPRFAASSESVGSASSHVTSPEGP